MSTMIKKTISKTRTGAMRREQALALRSQEQVDNSEHLSDEATGMSGDINDDSDMVDDGGFKTTGWIDQNVGTVSHFRCIYLAGLEVTYSGRKGYLTVHSRGEHRFNMPLGTLTQEEITQFAVSCAFQVLSEQYEVFKSDVAKMGCTLEG